MSFLVIIHERLRVISTNLSMAYCPWFQGDGYARQYGFLALKTLTSRSLGSQWPTQFSRNISYVNSPLAGTHNPIKPRICGRIRWFKVQPTESLETSCIRGYYSSFLVILQFLLCDHLPNWVFNIFGWRLLLWWSRTSPRLMSTNCTRYGSEHVFIRTRLPQQGEATAIRVFHKVFPVPYEWGWTELGMISYDLHGVFQLWRYNSRPCMAVVRA